MNTTTDNTMTTDNTINCAAPETLTDRLIHIETERAVLDAEHVPHGLDALLSHAPQHLYDREDLTAVDLVSPTTFPEG